MKLIALTLLLAGFGTHAFAANKEKDAHWKAMMNASPAQREEMAKMHDAMAACLRSQKSMADCHKEMRATCKDKLGSSCPMMGMGGHGMMHDHEMMEHEESEKK